VRDRRDQPVVLLYLGDGRPFRASRAAADAALAERIEVFHKADKPYGAPRITADLNDAKLVQEQVNHERVARIMQEHGIAGVSLRRRVTTTVSEPSDQKIPDLFKRDCTATAPNLKCVGDMKCRPRHLMSTTHNRFGLAGVEVPVHQVLTTP